MRIGDLVKPESWSHYPDDTGVITYFQPGDVIGVYIGGKHEWFLEDELKLVRKHEDR